MSSTDEAAAFELTAPGSGEDTRAPKPPPAPGADGRQYKRGCSRAQLMLLPRSIEDYVSEDNPVRAIAAYVDQLDLAALGFANTAGPLSAGQPAYDPGDHLKLYLYGYLNRVRSTRRLALECERNLEVIWLLGGLAPAYRSIGEFRKRNTKALKAVARDFVQLCRELKLISGERVGIDGSHFKANAGADSVKTEKQLAADLAALEREIERYHAELDAGDAAEAEQGEPARLDPARLEAITERAAHLRERRAALAQRGETQESRVDPDARRLNKRGRSVVGYNVQSAIDSQHKLILAAELTNAGNDLGQLVPMIEHSRAALGLADATAPAAPDADPDAAGVAAAAHASAQALAEQPPAEAAPMTPAAAPSAAEPEYVADTGYFTETDIATCAERGHRVYVSMPNRSSPAERAGRLPSRDFDYDAEQDCFHCPGGHRLNRYRKPWRRDGVLIQGYASQAKDCAGCALRERCLPKKTPRRELYRSEHAEVVERHRAHMDTPEAKARMRERGALCEHPFGTLKRWLGSDHFLLRGLEKAGAELALITHAYNFKRVLSIMGVEAFIAHCAERRRRREGAQGGDQAEDALASLVRLASALWQALCARAGSARLDVAFTRASLSAA
jgi:transposase